MLRLPQSALFESYAFSKLFPRLIEEDKWDEYDYIGTISWKAPLKFARAFFFGPFNMSDIIAQTPEGTDVIALVGQQGEYNLLERAEDAHPRFGEAWRGLLRAFDMFTPEQIETNGYTAFYCNYWLAKPAHVKTFIPFISKAQRLLINLPTIQEALWTDAKYLNNTKIAREVFGLNYYPNHPFLLERLTPFYFGVQNLKIFVYKKFGVVTDALPIESIQSSTRKEG